MSPMVDNLFRRMSRSEPDDNIARELHFPRKGELCRIHMQSDGLSGFQSSAKLSRIKRTLGLIVKMSNVRSVFKRFSSSETGMQSVEVDPLLALVAVVSCEDRWL